MGRISLRRIYVAHNPASYHRINPPIPAQYVLYTWISSKRLSAKKEQYASKSWCLPSPTCCLLARLGLNLSSYIVFLHKSGELGIKWPRSKNKTKLWPRLQGGMMPGCLACSVPLALGVASHAAYQIFYFFLLLHISCAACCVMGRLWGLSQYMWSCLDRSDLCT